MAKSKKKKPEPQPKQAKALVEPWLRDALICAVLLLATLIVFWPVRHQEFINFDDGMYVSENANVQEGLTPASIRWAFTTTHTGLYLPVTWLSYLLDVQLFGLNAGAIKLMNVFYHSLATLLLFWMLRRVTQAPWPSAVAALLFAIHPLHVESVAWVSTRKDVASGLCLMLMFLAYVRYSARPGWKLYGAVCLCFALGLMAKANLITAPLMLLAFDYWPLRRLQDPDSGALSRARVFACFREKIPLFLLSLASVGLTILAQMRAEAMGSLENFPLHIRIFNALFSTVYYLFQMLWPLRLTLYYPHLGHQLAAWQIGGAVAVLAGITAFAFWFRRSRSYLLAGWAWYITALLPNMGIMQTGDHGSADRYTYLPLIGIFIMLAWGVPALLPPARWRAPLLSGVTAAAMLFLMVFARIQVGYWQNNDTAFGHALVVAPKGAKVMCAYSGVLRKRGQFDKAFQLAREGVRLSPNYAEGYGTLGNALYSMGKLEEAIAQYEEALRRAPEDAETHSNLGNALLTQGKDADAIEHYREALRLDPDLADAHSNLGSAYFRQGKTQEAGEEYRAALRLRPNHADALNNLGSVCRQQGNFDEAIQCYEQALRLEPNHAQARQNLDRIKAEKAKE